MRMYALLRENVVVALQQVADEVEYAEIVKNYQNAVDVEDWLLRPSIGWVLSGGSLVPGPNQVFDIKKYIEGKITQYQSVAGALLIDLYATNTLSGLTSAQSDQMFEDFQDVLLRIREGAFPTAVYRLQNKTPTELVTQQMIDAWVAKIQAYIN